MRIEAFYVAAGDAGKHGFNLAIRHQLGLFNRALNGLHGGIDVDHDTFFKAA